jgi:hypothetical protein
MSRPRTILHSASDPSASSAMQPHSATGSSVNTGVNFFSRIPQPLMQYSLFPHLDLATKARMGMTGHYFFHLPQYDAFQKAANDFPSLKLAFLHFAAKGKLSLAELAVTMYPELLLEEGHVTASSGQEMFGTALGLAIMTEDFGREGCDLCLLPADGRLDDTTPTKLSLYSDGDAASPFTYRIKGQVCTIAQGNNADELIPEHFRELKAMYDAELKLQDQALNLSHAALNETQRKAYSAVLKITLKREHTLFVKEEGMREMLERHIRKCLPIDGEKVIANEWCKRLKDGWQERKAEKLQKELTALTMVWKAIANSRTNADCEKAIQTFINLIAPKGIIEEGFQWNKELLDAAFELGYKEYFGDNRKDDLFYDRIIGSIQDTAPDNAGMAQAQGLSYQQDEGEKFKRSLKFRYGDGSYFGRASDSWVDCYLGAARAGWRAVLASGGFSKLCASKNSSIAATYAAARQSLEAAVLVLSNVNLFSNPAASAAGGSSQQVPTNQLSSSSYCQTSDVLTHQRTNR